jgi:outer membrane lipoprotein-sorting protein
MSLTLQGNEKLPNSIKNTKDKLILKSKKDSSNFYQFIIIDLHDFTLAIFTTFIFFEEGIQRVRLHF